MQKKVIYLGMILLAIVLQQSFFSVLGEGKITGDAVLMLVLALAVLDGFENSLKWGLLAGVFYDLASFAIVGQHALLFLLVFYGVSFFSRRLSMEVKNTGVLLMLLFVILSSLLSDFAIAAFEGLLHNSSIVFLKSFSNFEGFIFQFAWNIGLFFCWYYLIKKVKRLQLV